MLSLQRAFPGNPKGPIHQILLQTQSLLLYPTADAVVILDAESLSLIRVLAFWEAFPGVTGEISCISVDRGMKIIVAAMGNRIASWSLSGVQSDTWRIHSSLVLPQGQLVTALDSKSGLLAVGTKQGLSVYTLILENDLPTWSPKWNSSLKETPIRARFAPSLAHIASTTKIDNAVRIYSTTTGRQIQVIPHPRPVNDFSWRYSQASSRDDLILYTITADATLRIFLPVLDSPQYLQLHASIDLFSSIPHNLVATQREYQTSSVFWLDRQVLSQSLQQLVPKEKGDHEGASIRRLRDIKEEAWDLFFRVAGDGSIVLTAVANIDRRPPTLLKHFTLQHTPPLLPSKPPGYLYILPNHKNPTQITLVTTPPLASYALSLSEFCDAKPNGLNCFAKQPERVPTEEATISTLIRTPEGTGVGVIRRNGGGDSWTLDHGSSNLLRREAWESADHVVVLDRGDTFATFSKLYSTLTLHTQPPATLDLPQITSLFTLPSNSGHDSIIGVTDDLSIVHVDIESNPSSAAGESPLRLILHSHDRLPVSFSPSTMIIPVDPMAWGQHHPWVEYDALLSISESGELAFWRPDKQKGMQSTPKTSNGPRSLCNEWRCTGRVKTARRDIKKARCSSAKKTALVTATSDGQELTIWDSKESEFASGMECCRTFKDTVNDLDWSSTPDVQSILAVGFLHHVELICQQRMTYFDDAPGWSTCYRIDIGNFIPYQISDSIWLAGGSLLIGAGHQMLLYDSCVSDKEGPPESLFDYVTRQNGPLPDYHPQMLLQCLLWDKVELVKDIIVNLSKNLASSSTSTWQSWPMIPAERFFSKDHRQDKVSSHKKRYTGLFNGPEIKDDEEDGFCRPLVTQLLEKLETDPLPHLTPNEHAHLLVLIQTTLEIDEQRRALDSNGLRYLTSMRSFYILNRLASSPASPESQGVVPRGSVKRERLRYRDMIWGFHSESQELLLNASAAACNGKMCWADARALGLALWLTSIDSMKSQFEAIARNEYMVGDARDPTTCSLFYFALGKVKLVHGLWRQASWHREQAVMLKFLSNDFTQARWRTAALKNAFALLGKQRFGNVRPIFPRGRKSELLLIEYAAAFFLLGDSLKDAVNVCVKQLNDFQLAVAIARIVEQSNDGPVLRSILNNNVLPLAFREGNRWLASWAFWLLHRRDLSVRVLVSPLQELVSILDVPVTNIGEPHYDDPSLALLFSQLRSKTLQAAKGNSEISGRMEFNFVLQIARVFCRMGCHVLALDLVRSWTFDHPLIHEKEKNADPLPPSPTSTRRSLFSNHRRRSSIMIDMDIPSEPPTRRASPERRPTPIPEEPIKDESDLFARKAGLGSLIQSAKQDVKVPEFDMNAFF
ncbi:regulator of (H+)-ATPase in vacuolar membrane [Paramarasmius palmivorus]|uniref:Regulator of (H+)-ATPase in vacuolar membrane n=1 Tax=Paramarasmius palmivorus TaxID=297713 RepID=A0AAW0E4U9_9AGAR